MFRTITAAAFGAAVLAIAAAPATAQVASIPDETRAQPMPRQELSGPRFGFTAFTGDVARARSAMGKSNIMSQFGWQFETRMVSTVDGSQALLEWLVLVGGVEQDELNLGGAILAGYRLPNGLEFGVGPHLGLSKDSEDVTTSMVVAGGATVPFGEINVPLNAAVAFADGGPRVTALVGWIIAR